MFNTRAFSKTSISVLLKGFLLVVVLPALIFMLFLALEKDYVGAWFWATSSVIGNLFLIIFSPKHKIRDGIKMLGFFSWVSIIILSLMPLLLVQDECIILRIPKALTFFLSFIGCSVFGVRVMRVFWR